MRIRPAVRTDGEGWATLRAALWPEASVAEHRVEIDRWFWTMDPDQQCVVAEERGRVVGFAEVSIRGYAEGCETSRVGYLEGWFVSPAARRRGIGRALVSACEGWARKRGCTEFASDAELTNEVSHRAHERCGFEEVERIVCYRKSLG